jgi:hypothetical protein
VLAGISSNKRTMATLQLCSIRKVYHKNKLAYPSELTAVISCTCARAQQFPFINQVGSRLFFKGHIARKYKNQVSGTRLSNALQILFFVLIHHVPT